MNSNTRQALKEFIDAVEQLAYALSSPAGMGAVRDIFEKGQKLKVCLYKDTTCQLPEGKE